MVLYSQKSSKNDRILLYVPPKADGSFAEEIKKELIALGQWLKMNGEGPTDDVLPKNRIVQKCPVFHLAISGGSSILRG